VTESLIVVLTEHHGRYRVQFAYDADVIAVLKKTVPAPMRHWIKRTTENGVSHGGYWEVNTDWIGPLASAFTNTGIEVLGLDRSNIADWFGVFSAATRTTGEGHRAYRKGTCKTCTTAPHRPGGVECEGCFHKRLIDQHQVKAALAKAGATPHPETRPATGSALTTRYPLEIDRRDVAIVERDHTAVVDILIAAEYEATQTCLICGRRPPKDAAVHATCRTRLLRASDDNKPFTKANNAAFQNDVCVVCQARGRQLPGGIACAHCATLIDVCRSVAGVVAIVELKPNDTE